MMAPDARPVTRLAARLAVAALCAVAAGGTLARGDQPLAEVGAARLPTEAREVLHRIHSGVAFHGSRDGVVFNNREHILPSKPRGYYHEYTVETPGARDRGARRIVCGGESKRDPVACYYTDDHYASFRRIRE